MKYVSQATIIFGFTLLGELLHALLPLPIPSAIYGLVLLFGALNTDLVKLEQVKDAGGFLISILPILFVSPAVGILDNWEAIRGALIPILALTLLSTVLTFGIAGRATQAMMGKEEKPNGTSGKH